MREIISDKARRRHALIAVLGITILSLVMLVSIAGAAAIVGGGPYAYITNSESNTVSVIDTATNNITATVNVGSLPFGVAVNPKGTKVYVANYWSSTVSVIDTATNNVTATVKVASYPFGVAVSPDGNKVFIASLNNYTVSVIDTSTNNVTATVNVGSLPWGVVVSPDGKKVYVASLNSNNVSVIDTATNNVTAKVNVASYPFGVAVSPDGKMVYVTNPDSNAVSVIDTATNNVTATVDVGSLPWGVAVSPDGKMVYVTNSDSDTVSIIDTATKNVTATVNVGNTPCGVSVSPDGKKVYVANSDSNTVSIIDTATNNVTTTVNVGSLPIAFGQFIVPPSPVANGLNIPVAAFSASPTSGSAPLNVSFTDSSTGSPSSWKWSFGDGTTSTEKNPVHTYNKAGQYAVTLTTSNPGGSSSVTKSSYIAVANGLNAPVAAFSASPTSGNGLLNVSFTDISTGSPSSWKWSFGDGTTSTEKNPVHTYNKTGQYAVSLTVNNPGGSSYVTKSSYIAVTNSLEVPVTAYSASPTSGPAPLNVSFTDISTGSPSSWKWSFGDGITSTEKNPVHTYNKTGQYTVTLTTSNPGGSSSVTKSSYIAVANGLNEPIAAFSASPTSGNWPLNISFTDSSTGSPTSRKWSFGDGTTSTDENPVHTYNKTGNYTVSLTVNNPGGSSTETMSGYIKVK